MRFVIYNGQVAIVAKSGLELTAEVGGNADLDDYLGLWFGKSTEDGRPIVYTVPAEYVHSCKTSMPEYRH